MTNRQRMMMAMNNQVPDKVPFAAYDVFFPRGSFERRLRNKGLCLIKLQKAVTESSRDHSTVKRVINSSYGYKEIFSTPYGDICQGFLFHGGRIASENAPIQNEWFIKKPEDYKPLIYLMDDMIYPGRDAISKEFFMMDDDLGEDGFVITVSNTAPYISALSLLGLEAWSFEQFDHPEEFRTLLDALSRQNERMFKAFMELKKPVVVLMGDISDNVSIDIYEKDVIPFYNLYGSMLKKAGMSPGIHAHASRMKRYAHLIPKLAVDWVDAFTPPPYGDLTLKEAREIWGEDLFILVNFPESIFYEGYEATYKYTVELIKSDPCPKKAVGFTEMGMMGVDDRTRLIFEKGVKAVIDAIEENPYN